ncbi:MAG TPA: AMP-binding protein [Puia sp.]|nr:AMP-binding protein [Puia sp.]
MPELKKITIGRLLQSIAGQYPESDAVVYPDRGLRLSYKKFDESCNEVARGLMSLGIEKGEPVAVWSTNRPEWLCCQFATGKIGAVLVTINTNYRTLELEYLLRQSDSSTIILMEEYRGASYIDMLYEIAPEIKSAKPGEPICCKALPRLKNVIVMGEKRYPGMLLWKDILDFGDRVTGEALEKRTSALHYDDVINMQYTSGTTGFPKGVMLTHYNVINNAANIADCMKLTHKDRMCIPVPFFHCFGCVLGTLACVTVGATMVPVQEFNVKQVLTAVEQEKCTALHGVPTMFISELADPGFHSYDLSSLRTGIMAGSPCPIEVMKAVVEKMGAKEITIAYGLTEASPVITQTKTDDDIEIRVSTVGRPLSDVEVKIVKAGTNKEVSRGVQGELCTRGYHVMKGYYKDAEATAQVIDKDGWLYTGDLAIMDERGYCRITGRLKDMIIRSGENIYPREIEEFLYKHPKILDVQIVGVPDEKYGEEVMAWIRLKEGTEATAEEIREYCTGKISRHKIPKYILFCQEYPMTASGKVQKFKLREQFRKLLNRAPDLGRFCLLPLIYIMTLAPAMGQMPTDTGYRILSPRFFPGWQAQHISYPFVLYDKTKGDYKMYYAGSSSTQVNESLWDQWVTGLVTSTNVLDWTYPESYEPVLFAKKYREGDVINPDEQAKQFDAVFAIDACVIRDGPLYKCWYTGWNGQTEQLGGGLSKKINFRVGYATSTDGMNWTKFKGSAGAGSVLQPGGKGEPDAYGVEDAYVIKENGIYRMWYTGYDGTTRRILYATSPDGTNWTKNGLVLLSDRKGEPERSGTENPVIIHRQGQYELWYQGRSAALSNRALERAISPDGISWKKAGEVLLHPSVPGPHWPWTSISPERDGKMVLGNIVVLADNSCQVFYAKQYIASKNVTYGVIQAPLSFIYTERINP